MQYRLVVFDLDGTLLYTLQDLADALNYALQKAGYPTRSLQQVCSFVGNGIRNLIIRGAPAGLSDAGVAALHRDFTSYYMQHCADKTRPYDGIVPLLVSLRQAGCKTAVLSNKADAAVLQLCTHFFPGLLDAAMGEKPGTPKKPAPNMLELLLQDLHVDKKDTVYVGDSDVDVQTALNAQVDGLFVDWGFRSRELLLQSGAPKERVVSSPASLLDKLQQER